jgi:hypothetical protein
VNDEHCRVTVVGERRRVDLAVPASAPIVTYVDALARLCGQPGEDALPPAWSLAPAAGRPYPADRSLAELGVVDGEILYLRDLLDGESGGPVVRDVREEVAEEVEERLERPWDARALAVTLVLLGLGLFTAALLVTGVTDRHMGGVMGAFALPGALLPPTLAWAAGERRWPVPPWLRAALALSAVPIVALACWALATGPWAGRLDGGPHAVLTATGLGWVALVDGALVGAFLAYPAAPGVLTCSVLAASAVAAALGTGLAGAGADRVQSAAVVAVVTAALLTAVPDAAVRILAVGSSRRRAPARGGDAAAAASRAALGLVTGWTLALAAVLGVALVVLAAARSPYAAGLAACLGVALLLRAGAARSAAEVVPVALAGTAGIAALVLLGPARLGWPGWLAPAAAAAGSVLLLVYGLRRLTRGPEPLDAGRPWWLTDLATALAGTGIALAAGTFGLFGWFVDLGQRL